MLKHYYDRIGRRRSSTPGIFSATIEFNSACTHADVHIRRDHSLDNGYRYIIRTVPADAAWRFIDTLICFEFSYHYNDTHTITLERKIS